MKKFQTLTTLSEYALILSVRREGKVESQSEAGCAVGALPLRAPFHPAPDAAAPALRSTFSLILPLPKPARKPPLGGQAPNRKPPPTVPVMVGYGKLWKVMEVW